jgi:transposase
MASNVLGRDVVTTQLKAWHRHDQTSQSLATIPGDGPIRGVSFALR